MTRNSIPWISVAVCFALVSHGEAQDFGAAAYKQLIIEQRSKIQSMYGVFTAETRPDALAEKAGLMKRHTQKSKVTFAWSGERRYLEDADVVLDQNLKPYSRGAINVFDGNESRQRKAAKIFRIEKVRSGDCDLNLYLGGFLKWPMTEDERAASAREPAKSDFLPYFLEADDWSRRPESESVDGVDCVVLEQSRGGRRLWLDPLRGYCMLKFVHDKPGTSNMLWVTSYGDFREVLDGIFFPMKVVSETVRRDSQGDTIGTLTTTFVVEELRCNDVSDDQFILEPRSGDQVFDEKKGLSYQYLPRDDKTLDTAASESKAGLDHVERARSSRRWGYFSLASFIGFAAGWWCIRWLRRKTP